MVRFENHGIASSEGKESPPYLLGLLGFIPLVGFFVGIFLAFYGIFKYKSRKLTIIGFLCILFTVLVYSSIYLVFDNLQDSKNGWNKMAQMQLNGLVKDIEFYKLQNGKYPDSLKQLLNEEDFVNIHDSAKGLKAREKDIFIYKNLNGKIPAFFCRSRWDSFY